jgi:hypothetical protein
VTNTWEEPGHCLGQDTAYSRNSWFSQKVFTYLIKNCSYIQYTVPINNSCVRYPNVKVEPRNIDQFRKHQLFLYEGLPNVRILPFLFLVILNRIMVSRHTSSYSVTKSNRYGNLFLCFVIKALAVIIVNITNSYWICCFHKFLWHPFHHLYYNSNALPLRIVIVLITDYPQIRQWPSQRCVQPVICIGYMYVQQTYRNRAKRGYGVCRRLSS